MKPIFATQQNLNILNKTLIFDANTTHLTHVDVGQYIDSNKEKSALFEVEISSVEFRTPQPKLEYLDVSGHALGKLHITHCPKLQTLYAFNCSLEEVIFEGVFEQLYLIDVTSNKLKSIELEKSRFPKLQNLFLNANQLTDLSSLAEFILDEDFDFGITENPLINPPEAIVKQGNDAVREHFKDIEKQGVDYLYEAKLLILGDPRAGKTTLAEKILRIDAPMPPDDLTTKGVKLGKWPFEHHFAEKGKKTMYINIWDFGGQTMYKQAHRFFLTQRSLYIILSDGGRSEKTDFKYWLYMTKIYGKDSPIIIFINEKEYRNAELPFKSFLRINANLKAQTNVNLRDADKEDNIRFLKSFELIKSQLVALPHIGEPVPSNWIGVRNKINSLEKEKVKLITADDFYAWCSDLGIKDLKTQLRLSRYFHDIGIFLHFSDNDILQRFIFIDKQWILDGAYKVVDDDDKIVKNKNGRLKKQEFDGLFTGEYAKYRLEIAELLKVFHLIYTKDNYYVVPQHLPAEQVKYDWNVAENVSFNFKYEEYMPEGILWQFIIEMKDHIKDNLVWQRGVILSDGKGAVAEVIEEYGKEIIKIRVQGYNKEEFRTILINEIEKINKQFNDLPVKRLVPCYCEDCQKSQEPFVFDYDELKKLQNDDIKTERCKLKSRNKTLEVSIDKLLKGVEFKDIREEKSSNHSYHANEINIIHNHMSEKNQTNTEPSSVYSYLIVFLVVMSALAYIFDALSWFKSILITIAGILFITLLAMLQMRNDGKMGDKTFLDVLRMIFGKITSLGIFFRRRSPEQSTEVEEKK